jgi:hypothetical protein
MRRPAGEAARLAVGGEFAWMEPMLSEDEPDVIEATEAVLQDDRGNSFSSPLVAPLPPDLARSITRRPLIDAHMLLVFGISALVVTSMAGPAQTMYGLRNRTGKLILFGIVSVVAALARYAGVGPGPRTDRRLLLKRALCPVCLEPLDKRQARGETITCVCGATWERRYM